MELQAMAPTPDDLNRQIEALRQELARLETQRTAMLTQHGAGAVANDGGMAGGERAVVIGGAAEGNIITTGDRAQIVQVRGNVYLGRPSRDPDEALAIYQRVLVASAQQMPLRGLDVGASDPTSGQQHFDLVQVYVDLHTTTQVPVAEEAPAKRQHGTRSAEQEMRPLPAIEAVLRQRHTVLLGDPGSGKSTFLTHLGLCLAAHGLEPQGTWLARLTGWPVAEGNVIPITVVLRDFARWLPDRAKRAEAWWLPDEPLLGFVEIPAGPFKMGSRQRDALANDDEKPWHTLRLPLYYMARYPATVAQFRAFVEASGHQITYEYSLQGQPHHPVRYLSWYEALVYYAWLTKRLCEWDGTPEPLATLLRQQRWCVTLPSEAEWEKSGARSRWAEISLGH